MGVNICLPYVKIQKSVYLTVFSYYLGNLVITLGN